MTTPDRSLPEGRTLACCTCGLRVTVIGQPQSRLCPFGHGPLTLAEAEEQQEDA